MNETNDKTESEEAQVPAGDPEPAAATQAKTGRAGVIALAAVILLAATAVYFILVIHPGERDRVMNEITQVAERTAQASTVSDELRQQLEALDASTQAMHAQHESRGREIGDIDQAVKNLYARESQSTLDWQLAEVEYLVFAATQRLVLERDVKTALAAMLAADERVAAAAHPELAELRSQFARDIAALKSVKLADQEGLAIYLAEAVTQVEGLPTKPVADLDMSFSKMTDETVQRSDWRGYLQALWIDLKSLVEIKDGKLEDSVLFDPELRYFLLQNLRLELASARLAVLKADSANFRASIRLVGDLIAQYFDENDGRVMALSKDLKRWEGLELAPAIPEISGSLDAVRAKREKIRAAALVRAQ